MPMTDRIDVHQHVMPPFWVDGMRQRNTRSMLPDWSPESAVEFMEKRRIRRGVMSLTAPGVADWTRDERPEMARRINEYTAEVVLKWPGRFGNFATLPLPDIEAALSEVAYALDQLGSDGIGLLSNYDGIYLGDPILEPLWAELDRREAIVFIHPTSAMLRPLDGIPPPFIDWPADTTRTAVDMTLKGVLDRHTKVKIILSHAGGFLPYAVQRVTACANGMRPDIWGVDKLVDTFRRFYFDTALSTSPFAIPSLKAFAEGSHILLGTDFPYAPGGMDEAFTPTLDASPLLSEAEHAAIGHANAAAICPKWVTG